MSDVQGKRVLVVGLARTGVAAARCLSRRGAVVTATDVRPPCAFADVIPELSGLKVGLELGSQRAETFLRQDLIVVSPGVPWDLPQLGAAREQGITVVPEVEVARWWLPNRLVGITGTNGKTTTVALLAKILEASGFSALAAGNIGTPLISAVSSASPETVLVVELSSFQLEAIQSFRPDVAVLLNITPNHLDRHASFRDYVSAKGKIFSNLRADDYAVLNADDPNVMGLAPALPRAQRIFFSRKQDLAAGASLSRGSICYRVGYLERTVLGTKDVRLRGAFNLENVLAASAAAAVLGAEFEAIRRAVSEFRGVEHRLEFVRNLRGVDFYNDSKATSVDAASKALSAFDRGVHLILGGKDKGAPYAPLRPLLKDRVPTVFLIGAAAERIAKELAGAVELVRAGDLATAVRQAFKRAGPGDVVLLSPACSSFDQFENYEHRGRVFKELVEGLAREVEDDGAKAPRGPESRRTASRPAATTNDSGAEHGPVDAQGRATSLDRVDVYEVRGEEMAPAEAIECVAESVEEGPLPELARSADLVERAPLLFEVTARGQQVGAVGLPTDGVSTPLKVVEDVKSSSKET